jgi:hypothetical protein
MTNEEKSIIYNNLIRQHDVVESKIADIKSEYPFGNYPTEISRYLSELEDKRIQIINQARSLFF